MSAGVTGQVKKVRVDEWFAAGEQDARHAELRQIIEHAPALVQGEFAGIFARVGIRIAMNALEIATAGDVPDDNGPAFGGGARSAVSLAVSQGVGGLGEAAVELGDVDHIDGWLTVE